jgi:hypothetical protein
MRARCFPALGGSMTDSLSPMVADGGAVMELACSSEFRNCWSISLIFRNFTWFRSSDLAACAQMRKFDWRPRRRKGTRRRLFYRNGSHRRRIRGRPPTGGIRIRASFRQDRTRRRRRAHLEHQAVGYALADAKMAIEAVRALNWRPRFPNALDFRRHDRRGSRGSAMPRLQCERVVAALVSPNGHIRIRRSPNFVDSSFLKFVF